eukprot:10128825-Alexandrium_andersonii.AAC.1
MALPSNHERSAIVLLLWSTLSTAEWDPAKPRPRGSATFCALAPMATTDHAGGCNGNAFRA